MPLATGWPPRVCPQCGADTFDKHKEEKIVSYDEASSSFVAIAIALKCLNCDAVLVEGKEY